MMQLIKLHPEVIKFLDTTGTVHMQDGEKTFIVNSTWYSPTDDKEVYTVQFIQ